MKDKEIIEGWERVAKDFELRELTSLEKRQVARAEIEEELAKNTPFILGELL
jgi:hypothetical protein